MLRLKASHTSVLLDTLPRIAPAAIESESRCQKHQDRRRILAGWLESFMVIYSNP